MGIFLLFLCCIPTGARGCGYIPAFPVLYTHADAILWVYSCFSCAIYPRRCDFVGIFLLFLRCIPTGARVSGYRTLFPSLYTHADAGLWVYSCFSCAVYPLGLGFVGIELYFPRYIPTPMRVCGYIPAFPVLYSHWGAG